MNSIERIMTMLSFKEPDCVPVYPILSGVNRKLVNADYPTWSKDSDVCANSFIKAARDFDLDCVVTLVDLSIEVDAWGQEIVYPKDEAALPNYKNCIIKDISDYKKIKKVDYKTSKRMMFHIDVCKKIVDAIAKDKIVVAFVFGPLGVLSMMRHQEEMYMDLYDDPEAVKTAAREVNETLKEYTTALIDVGVHAVMLDTLYASGSIMSKDMWMEMEGGLVTELANVCHDRKVPVMIHNCGQNIYFDVQIETMKPVAISFHHPPDDCKDFAETKAKWGNKVGLAGCVPPFMAHLGTDEEWEKECKRHIDLFAKGGGYMLATGCEYPANASFDRAKKMVEIARTYGKYKK